MEGGGDERGRGGTYFPFLLSNDAINYKPSKTGDPVKIKIGNDLYHVSGDSKKIADHFNVYYVNVGKTASASGSQSASHFPLVQVNRNYASSLYLRPTSEKEIGKVISSMRGESAGGHDGIQIKTLKQIKPFITKPLQHIYNCCFKNGVYPTSFKLSIVKPIYKKGDSRRIENFRPISLTTAFSKIFERIIKTRLNKFIEENNILHASQYGFREGRNTTDAITNVLEFAYGAMDKGDMAAILFLDFSKAFDTVDHRVLINILRRIGIDERPLDLFKSYLCDRRQMVKIGNTLSSELGSGHFSTPQGTVLSPLLYNIYVHEIYNIALDGQLVSYADDTALCVRGKTWPHIYTSVQKDMRALRIWFESHNLFLNLTKCKILPLCITKPKLPIEHSVTLHEENCDRAQCTCCSIEIVASFKYLGVELDQHLRWEAHVTSLVKRMRAMIYSFLVLRKFLSIKMLKQIYFCLCQSILEYAICGYGRANTTVIHKLAVVQNSVLKIIHRKPRLFSTDRLYKESKVLNIHGLFTKNMCSLVHKNDLLSYHIHPYPTRQLNVILPKLNRKKSEKSISFMGIKMYNLLPPDIKHESDRKVFKLKLKRWLLENSITF